MYAHRYHACDAKLNCIMGFEFLVTVLSHAVQNDAWAFFYCTSQGCILLLSDLTAALFNTNSGDNHTFWIYNRHCMGQQSYTELNYLMCFQQASISWLNGQVARIVIGGGAAAAILLLVAICLPGFLMSR